MKKDCVLVVGSLVLVPVWIWKMGSVLALV